MIGLAGCTQYLYRAGINNMVCTILLHVCISFYILLYHYYIITILLYHFTISFFNKMICIEPSLSIGSSDCQYYTLSFFYMKFKISFANKFLNFRTKLGKKFLKNFLIMVEPPPPPNSMINIGVLVTDILRFLIQFGALFLHSENG